MVLKNKNILLGITGSISAYKACDLVQQLKTQGATVKVIMTASAAKIITPLTLTALTGYRVQIKVFDENSEAAMEHVPSPLSWARRQNVWRKMPASRMAYSREMALSTVIRTNTGA